MWYELGMMHFLSLYLGTGAVQTTAGKVLEKFDAGPVDVLQIISSAFKQYIVSHGLWSDVLQQVYINNIIHVLLCR